MARRKDANHGGHGWFVTFADLMALLVSFFVMLVAFSTQDSNKLQIVAGSMREAFGVQDRVRYSGIIEIPGLPTRPKLKNAAPIPPEEASGTPSDDNRGNHQAFGGRFDADRNFALAAASLRQALQDMPEISEVSRNIIIEESRQGLNIEIVDQNGRSMFPEGSREPYERTRLLIRQLAVPLRVMPFRISVSGHTSASRLPPPPNYGPWELSADRANAVRKQLESEGIASARFFMVAGRADTQPLFPDDPFIAANRRVTITLMREEPPLPANAQP
ncbi:MAG: flagellar motor protein MotB [Hyphomicrobiales bacterium]|nr:flagellar motor protein MotB [Hyphomicrobiales bacterium]